MLGTIVRFVSILFCCHFAYANDVQEISDENKAFLFLSDTAYVYDSGTSSDLPELPSPRSLVSYYNNFENIGSSAYDLLEKFYGMQSEDKFRSRFRRAFFLLNAPLLGTQDVLILNPHSFFVTAGIEAVHEYAHRSRKANFSGYDSGFNPDYIPKGDNPYSFSLGLIGHELETGSDIWKDAQSRVLFTPKFLTTSEHSFVEYASGINQQANLAKNLAVKNSLRDELDVATFFSYYWNSAAYFIYEDNILAYMSDNKEDFTDTNVWNDRALMIANWKNRGYRFSDKDMAEVNILSFLLSGTSWSYFKGIGSYIASGKRDHKPLRIAGLRLPDFYNFYNLEGPSVKMTTDYKFNSFYLTLEYEFIYDDGHTNNEDSNKETTVGVAVSLFNDKVSLISAVSHNSESDKYNSESELNFKLTKFLNYGIGISTYHLDTLSGGRDIPSIEKSKNYTEIFNKVYIVF